MATRALERGTLERHLVAEAGQAARRGLPFARPLVLEFADDPATWRVGDQFLWAARLWLREGAVIPMGPDVQWVGERPTDPLTVVVGPFEAAGRTELAVPVDDTFVTVRYEARGGRHQVQVEGHAGEVVLDAPAGVELRR